MNSVFQCSLIIHGAKNCFLFIRDDPDSLMIMVLNLFCIARLITSTTTQMTRRTRLLTMLKVMTCTVFVFPDYGSLFVMIIFSEAIVAAYVIMMIVFVFEIYNCIIYIILYTVL